MKLETYSEVIMETSIISAVLLFAFGWYWYYQGEDIGGMILGAIMVAGVIIIHAIIEWECRHGSLSQQLVENRKEE